MEDYDGTLDDVTRLLVLNATLVQFSEPLCAVRPTPLRRSRDHQRLRSATGQSGSLQQPIVVLFSSRRRNDLLQSRLPTRLMNDAAGVAQGVRREFDTLVKTQTERWLRDLDLVKREEFEAVKDMARLAREENEALKVRLAALEARFGVGDQSPPTAPPEPGQPGILG